MLLLLKNTLPYKRPHLKLYFVTQNFIFRFSLQQTQFESSVGIYLRIFSPTHEKEVVFSNLYPRRFLRLFI